ncbi:ABC transporter substrate-binding protein [Bacillus marinisedimentorum]|uniref:ABC transporter substrate-binding protein n=1 Tax=Bacillus marinisedimentorum TaxID=1821260 RepID=UPI0008733C29|nr:ABC transporter substrate-binding protein [Bacillus marinisedimentorum]
MLQFKKGLPIMALLLLLVGGCGTTAQETGGDNPAEAEAKNATIGVTQIVEHPSLDAAFEGFKDALAEAGFKEGENVKYDVQIAQGDMNNAQTIASNFTNDGVDMIFANSTPSAQSALNATKDIPIIFTSVTDPAGANLVESMDKAGQNITGTTDIHPDAIPNTVKFMSEEAGASKVGMIYNSGEQNSVSQVEQAKKAMEGTGMEVVEATVSTTAEVKQAAESLVGRADVFYIITDNTVVSAIESVVNVASEHDMPLFTGELDSVKRGAFAAYGFDYYDIGFEAGQMAAQVLNGEKEISEIPPQYPQNLKLVMNKQAADEMGVDIKEAWSSEAEFLE